MDTDPVILSFLKRSFPNCCLCPGPHDESHHNDYRRKGRELLKDFAPLCSPCHAWHEWGKKNRPAFYEWLHAQRRSLDAKSIRLAEIGAFIEEHTKQRIERLLFEASEEIEAALFACYPRMAAQERKAA